MPDFPLINPERLARLADVPLKKGAHSSPDAGMCALEAAAWIAGEPHSDHPECVCPVPPPPTVAAQKLSTLAAFQLAVIQTALAAQAPKKEANNG